MRVKVGLRLILKGKVRGESKGQRSETLANVCVDARIL